MERTLESMKRNLSLLLAAVLTLALTACGASVSGESVDVNGAALRPEGEAAQIYEHDGLKLLVPMEYDALVVVDTSPDGALFSVAEKASIEFAKAQGDSYDGAGWLFSLRRIGEEELRELLCYDMSGMEAFAKDADGNHYVYCHPTDVRVVRDNYDDIEDWAALNEWAVTVPDAFIAENPGLSADKRGNTELDMYLARLAYMDNVNAALNGLDIGAVDAEPYLARLMNGVTFEPAEDIDAPDGEYLTLEFPDDDIGFDFFLTEGAERYIRRSWSDGFEIFYEASASAGAIVSEWYDALSAAIPDDLSETSGFTGEEFVGEWQDSVSQRAVMSVRKTDEVGAYDILVHWGGSYNSAVQWRMRAVSGAQDEILSYENGVKAELLFPDDGSEEQETILWDNGTGYLMFRDGFLTWYDEQEPQAADCRFVK